MATKVYAVAETVPERVGYLTAGKRYEVVEDFGLYFDIIDDGGGVDHCCWSGCGHLDGGNWTRIEVDEDAPAPTDPLTAFAQRIASLPTDAEQQADPDEAVTTLDALISAARALVGRVA